MSDSSDAGAVVKTIEETRRRRSREEKWRARRYVIVLSLHDQLTCQDFPSDSSSQPLGFQRRRTSIGCCCWVSIEWKSHYQQQQQRLSWSHTKAENVERRRLSYQEFYFVDDVWRREKLKKRKTSQISLSCALLFTDYNDDRKRKKIHLTISFFFRCLTLPWEAYRTGNRLIEENSFEFAWKWIRVYLELTRGRLFLAATNINRVSNVKGIFSVTRRSRRSRLLERKDV